MNVFASIILNILNSPFEVPAVRTTSAIAALEAVLATAGASLPKRDSVDTRIAADVRARSGSIIDSQQQVGGWPELVTSQVPPDSDSDGMPDEWERRYGLNPLDPSDGNLDKDHDGYRNIEEFLNRTDPRKDKS